jgi:hypothetical protein
MHISSRTIEKHRNVPKYRSIYLNTHIPLASLT